MHVIIAGIFCGCGLIIGTFDTDCKKEEKLVKAVALFIILINIFTFCELRVNPSISRILAHSTGHKGLSWYKVPFIGNFQYIYSLCMLVPVLVHTLCRKAAAGKALILALLLTSGMTVVKSGYTFAILFMVGFSVLGTVNVNKRSGIVVVLAFIVLAIIVLMNMISIIEFVSNMFGGQSTYVGRNIDTLKYFFTGEYSKLTSDGASRRNLYLNSISIIKVHPLFGIGYSGYLSGNVGGHSEILDLGAYYGMIGLSLFLLALFIMARNSFKKIPKNYHYIYTVMLVEYFFLLVVNPGFQLCQVVFVFVIGPLLLNYISSFEKNICLK